MTGLGTSVELEALAPRDSEHAPEHGLVAELRAALRIDDARLLANGYREAVAG